MSQPAQQRIKMINKFGVISQQTLDMDTPTAKVVTVV